MKVEVRIEQRSCLKKMLSIKLKQERKFWLAIGGKLFLTWNISTMKNPKSKDFIKRRTRSLFQLEQIETHL